MPAAEVGLDPAPAAEVRVHIPPAPATDVGVNPLTDGLVADDVPVTADLPLLIRATGLVPVAGLRDLGIAVLRQALFIGEAGLRLAGAVVFLFAALRFERTDFVDALRLAAFDQSGTLGADVVRAGALCRILAQLILLAVRAERAWSARGPGFVRLRDVGGRRGGPTPNPFADAAIGLPLAVFYPLLAARVAGVVIADLLLGQGERLAVVFCRDLGDVRAVAALSPCAIGAELKADETTQHAFVLTEGDVAGSLVAFVAGASSAVAAARACRDGRTSVRGAAQRDVRGIAFIALRT